MIFSIVTKNSHFEILTKNLLLKDKMGLTKKNFNFGGVHRKIQFLRRGGGQGGSWFMKNQYRGGLGQFADLRGA